MRSFVPIVIALCVGACSSDDDAADTGASTGTGASTDDGVGPTSDDSGPSSATSDSTGSPGSTGATDPTGTGSADDTTGGGLDGVVLQNDAWTPADAIEFQTWPNQEDCWASVFTADAADYPFEIVGAIAAIGGGGDTVTFSAAVWEVDGDGMPTQELASTDFDVDGSITDLTEVDLSGLGLEPIDGGDFAIVMCHTEHMGAPSIAIDADGTVDAARNWVFQQAMGEWVPSPDFFAIDGDFILRAVIAPQG